MRYTLSTLGRDRGYTTTPLPPQDLYADPHAEENSKEAIRMAHGDPDPDLESDPLPDDLEEMEEE